jgi:phosphoglycerate dehydrogenase-like enzyme
MSSLATPPATWDSRRVRVALTGDFFDAAGEPRYPEMGLELFDETNAINVSRFVEHRPEIAPEQYGAAQGIVVLAPRVTAASLGKAEHLLAVGRFGVGYDTVDVPACTAADVVAFITPGAVDRSVAEATVCWMLALSHHLLAKDRLVRTGRWDDRSAYHGTELRGKTLGLVGFGRIGRAVVELLRGFGMSTPLAFDPHVTPAEAGKQGVRLATLHELLQRSDFVSVHCPLTEGTRNLLGVRELALMPPHAFLLNTARGGIVDEDALYETLKARRIAGAALDCFVGEPITSPHRFGALDNVILAPHSIAHTHELFRDIGRAVCGGMLDLSRGGKPAGVLNPEVFDRASFREKWHRLTQGPRMSDKATSQ